MTIPSLTETIANYRLFRGFTPEEIGRIFLSSKVKVLEPGDILIYPGENNDTLYLLLDGGLKVILEKDDTKISIPINPGECLGEMSLVMGSPTSALAIADKTSRVLLVPEDVFWNQVAVTRQGARNLMSMMAMRLHRNNQALIKEVEEQLKYHQLEKELETAGKIQTNIVPDGTDLFPRLPEVDVYALMHQAREVGGDFYDALILDPDHIYIAIGDVSGKGMPAALFMMRIFTYLRLIISNNPSLEGVMPTINNVLAKNNDDMMFVSLFTGVLNIRTGVFRYANAGHNPPFAAMGGVDYQPLEMPNGTLLGISDQELFELAELKMEPGDSLLLYTDGVTEAARSDQVQFDIDRTQRVLNERKHETMKDLVHSLEASIKAFVDKAPQSDDLTILAIRYLG